MKLPMMHDETTHKNLPDGLYIGFFHGRNTPEEAMDDWGFDGPVIGPLKWWHTTYNCNVRGELVEPSSQEHRELLSAYIEAGLVRDRSFTCNGYHHLAAELQLDVNNDLAVIGGKYYGDWSVFCIKNGEVA